MVQTFRLTNEPGGLGLSCTAAGLSLAGVPLLRKTEAGLEPRPPRVIAALLKTAYDGNIDYDRFNSSLGVIARALNSGNLARAMTAAVLSRTPELSSEAAARLGEADEELAKYNPDEPRDYHGRWTTDGGGSGPEGQLETEFAADRESEAEGTQERAQLIPAALTASNDNTNGAQESAQLIPAAFAASDDNTEGDKPDSAKALEETFERKYDDLGPVEFSKQATQFGQWLEREGRNLAPVAKARALAEYAFLQDRLSFWLAYDYTPARAYLNLLSAADFLYQGAVNGGLVGVRQLPRSMLDAAVAMMGLEGGTSRVGSSAEPDIPPIARAKIPEEIEGLGGVVPNSKVGIHWTGSAPEQGNNFEAYAGQQNPEATKLPARHKTFDFFNWVTHEAISAKTLNTLTVNYIRNPQRIYFQLKRYIDAAADYEPYRDSEIKPEQIQSRTIHVAIPASTNPAQWRYLFRAIRYGKERGVWVVITRISE